MCCRDNELIYIEFWSMIAEILTKYIRNTEINGNDNFKVMKSILSFPFHTSIEDLELVCIIYKLFSTMHLFAATAFLYINNLTDKNSSNSVENYV